MFQVDNFISFHDLTPEAQFLWASSSIVTCLGYEPEEVVGMNAYEAIHKDDIAYVKITHTESVLNEMVGTQVLLRMRHKNGTYVSCMVLFSMCYEYIVSCFTVVDQSDGTIRKVSAHSAAMTSLVGSKKEEFERIRRHHQAFRANTWNANSLELEPRACMLLNRFTRNLGIMYASPSCQMIFGIDPDECISKPFLLYIRADDLVSFVEQVDVAKSSTVVSHMRFWFQSPACRQEIPCEAMLFGAADASGNSAYQSGTRAYRAPLRGVPIGSINSIRNLDTDHNRLRPLTSLHEDESDIVDSDTALPEIYRLRKHQIQESEVDSSGLETGIEELDISDDDDYDEVIEISDDDDDVEEVLMPPPPRRRKEAKRDSHREYHHHQDMHLI
ncbi:hypothetical protein BGX26_010191 [Mortierella sp. AD094]|nr:hypothetical protein BGX26_010191 [Mortierella sp. AD094]